MSETPTYVCPTFIMTRRSARPRTVLDADGAPGPRAQIPPLRPRRPAPRAVDEHERGMRSRRHGLVAQIHLGLGEAAHGRDQERQVLRAAARHDRVGRQLLHGGQAEAGLERGDHVAGAAPRAREHRVDRPAVGATSGKPSLQPRARKSACIASMVKSCRYPC